jgi:drug/metabolite transporter (DMT)-like permease
MPRRTLLLSLVVSLLWGLNFAIQKIGLRHADPIFLSSVRLWGAGGVLIITAAVLRRRVMPTAAEMPGLVVLGLCTGAMGAFIYLSLARVDAGLGGMLLYTFPLITAGLAAFVLGERMTARSMAGAVLGFAGVALIAGRPEHSDPLGVLFMLCAATAWATGSVAYKRVAGDRDPLLYTAWSLLIGGATQSLVSLAVEGIPRVEPGWQLAWSYAYMTIPGLALAWWLWFTLLRSGQASRASALLFMTPAFGVLFGWLVLGEQVTGLQLAGGALIGMSIVLVAPVSSRAEEPESAST